MKNSRTDLTALALVAIVVTAITLLTLNHQTPPEILSTVALVSLGIGGGIAIPNRGSSPDTATAAPVAAAVEASIAAVVPEPRAAEPAPVATHAP